MSESDTRSAPTRGRSSTRGGRAGFGRGGPRGGRKTNGTSTDTVSPEESLEAQGELGEMKKRYNKDLPLLKDMFPHWTDTDLVFALEEANGDIAAVAEKIVNGGVSQFAEVKKPKDRARSKVKDEPAAAGVADKSSFGSRGARGRGGFDGSRGGRGRGSERGRGGLRGARGGHASTNGTIKEPATESVPTTESLAWASTATTASADGGWDTSAADVSSKDEAEIAAPSESAPITAPEVSKSTVIPEGSTKKSWASMFKTPPAHVPKQILTKQSAPSEAAAPGETVENAQPHTEQQLDSAPPEVVIPDSESTPPAPAILEPEQQLAPQPIEATVERPATSESEGLALTPSKDPLTEENVEHLPDESIPPATQTVASTAGSADPRNLTPLPSQLAPIGRPPMGGYAIAANRLAGTGNRSASFQRRVQEQQEAVVMPGHNALDRAAVQFGSMGLNGEPGLDVDEEREEPETRQAPQHSPPSQPRTSLPPAPRHASQAQESSMPEALPTPKQAPGLPPASLQNQQQIQDPSLTQGLQQEQHVNHAYNQYGRYGQQGLQQDTGAQQQKPYDPFGQAQQEQYNQYGAQSHQPQQQSQSGFGGLSSAPSEYSNYYTSDQSRNAYNQYYGNAFGPQETRTQGAPPQSQHEAAVGQQRSASGFGAGHSESAYGQQTAPQTQSRFGDAPGSGNNTPNPVMSSQQQQQQGPPTQQSQQSMHQAQGHQQSYGATPGFPYGHPYYNSPYQTAYANQFGYSGPVGGYGGGGFPGKQGSMYGAQHGYGIGSQSSYEQHSSSPANASAFSQNQQSSMRSASGMSSGLGGLDEYGRSSAQPASHQQSSAFGSMGNDPFARSTSGFGSQGYGQQSMSTGPEDSLKPFNETKGGPSPAIGQPGRPGSAANNAAAASQTGLPPPQQSQHSSFGGYPGFPGQGSQYGGLGGLGGHQQQGQGAMGGQSAYGSYGSGGGFSQYSQYGASRGGGGWGAQYTQH